MKTLPFGQTGVEVSALCMGTAYFGSTVERETSYKLLDQYFEAGGRFLDTANNYAAWTQQGIGGDSEKLLGEWMRDRGNRFEMFVATKVGAGYPGATSGLGAGQIVTECEKSLNRLRTDVLDLYYAHMDDRDTPLEETMEAFDRLVTVGKVRFIGASNYWTWRLEEARWISETRGWANYSCVQQHYTYLHPRPNADFAYMAIANEELFDYARLRNLTILAYHTMLWGAYAGEENPLWSKYAGQHNEARMAALRKVAEQTGATANQVVLAWMLHRDPPVLPLIGTGNLDHLRENLGALNLILSAEQMKHLNKA